MKRILSTALFVFLAGALACMAGETLTIRLVEATNKAGGDSKGIEDVIVALRNSLVFKSYVLVGSARQGLPGKGEKCRLGELTVRCSGEQKKLDITVHRGRKQLLKTTVKLPDNKPLVLGGFSSKNGKLVLIFRTQ